MDPLLIAFLALVGTTFGAGYLLRARAAEVAPAAEREAPSRPAAAPLASPWVAGLSKTRGNLVGRLLGAWRGASEKDAWLSDAEAILLGSDVGVTVTGKLVERLRAELREASSADELKAVLKRAMREALAAAAAPDGAERPRPWVVLVVGVNGVGKTTTIGKLAHRFRAEGKKVLMVAGDTFRAAAIEQLTIWAERTGVDIVKHQHGADPAAVAFDGVKAAQARGVDVVLLDTAGRLHVKENLMEELKKVARTIDRQLPGAPHEVLLVVDATTGQNALTQARVFHEAIRVDGVVLTKLDGTARGGVALAIRSELGVPIRWVGLGERPEDLTPFDADEFVSALFGD